MILLVKKILVIFKKSFGMVSYGYISILVPFGATQPEISSNVNTESKGGVLLWAGKSDQAAVWYAGTFGYLEAK